MHKPQGNTLSNLSIDADKNWRAKGITNIKEIAQAMATGHIIQHNGTILETLAPGNDGEVLTSKGPGHLLTWGPAGTYFNRYLPVTIGLSKSTGKVSIAQAIDLNSLLETSYENQLPPDLSPELGVDLDTTKITVSSADKNVPVGTSAALEMLLDGAIAHYGDPTPSDHDELSESRSTTVNDMHLPPQNAHDPPDEDYYFGCLVKFDGLYIDVSTAGNGNFAVRSIQYWNGAWTDPADMSDHLNDFQSTGICYATWTMPGDWALKDIGGYNLYWVQIACTSMVNLTTAPLGKRAYVRVQHW